MSRFASPLCVLVSSSGSWISDRFLAGGIFGRFLALIRLIVRCVLVYLGIAGAASLGKTFSACRIRFLGFSSVTGAFSLMREVNFLFNMDEASGAWEWLVTTVRWLSQDCLSRPLHLWSSQRQAYPPSALILEKRYAYPPSTITGFPFSVVNSNWPEDIFASIFEVVTMNMRRAMHDVNPVMTLITNPLIRLQLNGNPPITSQFTLNSDGFGFR